MNLIASIALILALAATNLPPKPSDPVHIVIAVDRNSHVTYSVNGKKASCADVNRLINKWRSKKQMYDCSRDEDQPVHRDGPQQVFSGVYFTNFEVSKFFACSTKRECDAWATHEGEWLDCSPRVCKDLDHRVSKLGVNPRGGTSAFFDIQFAGRRSQGVRAKQFPNDTSRHVLVEKILKLEMRRTVK
jgi:hypothetical protein